MKARGILTLLLYLITAPWGEVVAQHVEVGASYAYVMPFGKMAESMDPFHAGQIKLMYGFKNSRIEAGLRYTTGRYDRFREDVDFVFPDGSSIVAPLIVSHNLSGVGLVGQYRLVEAGPLQPYLMAGVNLAIAHSRLQVRDPDRNASAEGPLNIYDENLHREVALSGSIGVGLRADVGHLFRAFSRNQLFAEAAVVCSAGPGMQHAYSPAGQSQRGGTGDAESTGNYAIREGDLHTMHIYESNFSMLSVSLGLSWHFLSIGKSDPSPTP